MNIKIGRIKRYNNSYDKNFLSLFVRFYVLMRYLFYPQETSLSRLIIKNLKISYLKKKREFLVYHRINKTVSRPTFVKNH